MANISKISALLGATASVMGLHLVAAGITRHEDSKEWCVVTDDLNSKAEIVEKTREEVSIILGSNTDSSNTLYLHKKMGVNLREILDRKEWMGDYWHHYFFAFPYIGRAPFSLTAPTWKTQNLETREFVTVQVNTESAVSVTHNPESVREFLLQAYPQGWNGHIAQFTQTPARIKSKAKYGRDSEVEMKTTIIPQDGIDVSIAITSYQIPVNSDQHEHTKSISHEVCHANDWQNAQFIGLVERYEILKRLLDRIKAEDRFHTDEVESIRMVNGDEEKFIYLKVSEYWAEICSQWFEDETKLSLEDFTLVLDWIHEFQSGYSQHQYQAAQQKFLSEGVVNPLNVVTDHLSKLEKRLMEIEIEFQQKSLQLDQLKEELVDLRKEFVKLSDQSAAQKPDHRKNLNLLVKKLTEKLNDYQNLLESLTRLLDEKKSLKKSE